MRLLPFAFVVLSVVLVVLARNNKIKREFLPYYPLSDVTADLAKEDLADGLKSLTPSELQELSQFVDEQSRNSEGEGFFADTDVAWHGFGSKKKRTIDDVYDDMARENAGFDINKDRSEHGFGSKKTRELGNFYDELAPENAESAMQNKDRNEMPNDGRCRCSNQDEKRLTVRTKRNSHEGSEERDVEQYVRELEDSFPRDQDMSKLVVRNKVRKNDHIRIKRL